MVMSAEGLTVERALQVGVTMEEGAYKLYTGAQRKVKDPGSKQLLRELAADEAKHREYFVAALKDPRKVMDVSKAADLKRTVADLKVSDPLRQEPLNQDASYQDILIFAAKSEKLAYEFYSALAKEFNAHPVGRTWATFAQMELGHKQRIEKEYDDVVLREN
jgi:rubrerythrin